MRGGRVGCQGENTCIQLDWSCMCCLHRSEFLYRERFNLAGADRNLVADDPVVLAPPVPVGGPFAAAWRNYLKSVLKKGFMFKLSCNPSVVFYIAENKTLAGKEERTYEGEALGRKLAIVFFEEAGEDLVRRVHRASLGMEQQLLSIAELLQTIGGVAVPADPERTAAQTEILLETLYQDLEILRFTCTVEPAADVHMYTLGMQVNAELAFSMEVSFEHRTKMALARSLQRNEEFNPDETLPIVWGLSLANLRGRTAHLFPAGPPDPPAPDVPAAGRGRGKGRGRGRG